MLAESNLNDLHNDEDNYTEYTLTDAIECNDLGITIEMLESADVVEVNKTTNGGNTLLMVAIKNSNIEIVKLLLKNGANVNVTNNYGHTALMIAVLNKTVSNITTEIVKLFLKNGANVNATNKRGWNALMMLADGNDNIEIAKLLLGDGINVSATTNKSRSTALMIALANYSINIAKLLLKNGADARNKANAQGQTAMMIADKQIGKSQRKDDISFKSDYSKIIKYMKQISITNKAKKILGIMLAASIIGLSVYSFIDFKYLGIPIFNNAKQAYPILLGSILGACFVAHDLHQIFSLQQRSHIAKNLAIFILKLSLAGLSLLLAPIAVTGTAATLTCLSIASSSYASASILEIGITKCFSIRDDNNVDNQQDIK
ncbi:MAG: hypothetical protein COB50_03105 [Thiotrichales bacterium]|nr:MAG: hypothetical protein COB50_03105 [Thiotrichales bacterium]